MNDEAWPEPDRSGDAPHPRETAALFGQARAEAEFLEAFNSDRLHHGWLISGPKGIGKATMAWKIARFLLSQPVDAGADMFGDPVKPTDLSTPEDHGVMRRTRALAEPQLFLLRRGWDDKGKKLPAERRKRYYTNYILLKVIGHFLWQCNEPCCLTLWCGD